MKTPFLSSTMITSQAQHALLLKNAPTPLMGGVSQETSEEPSLASKIAQTPSILLTKRQMTNKPDEMLPPPSKRVGTISHPSRLQTPMRDEFKINQSFDHDGADSAWEKSSIASGV